MKYAGYDSIIVLRQIINVFNPEKIFEEEKKNKYEIQNTFEEILVEIFFKLYET